jgi:hypothetical protein
MAGDTSIPAGRVENANMTVVADAAAAPWLCAKKKGVC